MINYNISWHLLKKKYKNQVFYYLDYNTVGTPKITPCILGDFEQTIKLFKPNDKGWEFELGNLVYRKENLFENLEDAKKLKKEIETVLSNFKYVPFGISFEDLKKNLDIFFQIENTINFFLEKDVDYDGIDFCNVGAGGIQIRLHHKKVKEYTVGEQFTLKYDLSNAVASIKEVVSDWENLKNLPEY